MNKQTATKNLDSLITKVEAARLRVSEHHIVKIVGVSKYSTAQDVKTLYEAGQRAFGENKVQDLKQKSEELEEFPIEWHFIGTLQKNKINNLIDLNPTLVQSLDSLDLAIELNKKLESKNKKLSCLLQINSAYEDSKSGVYPEVAVKTYKDILEKCPNIILKGVMSIGAHVEDENIIKESFKTTKKIFDELAPFNPQYCSMGMSSDFELAIECGSNLIRVGSSLFKNK
ncbi:YggS family pyridoxal phosphate-dependent enzyme [Aliarcobacter skirrowii]|uniref:Pyridoxal phosphate homeostasis protein n=1 Tax=Aliarcobacter skirrowii CCUG 10374 TaxID=1032239 RepID=A0AAD0SQ81_9BACT|nr:YggS family pyridoxal phosphate-dependent enzyme [Aliarcobacter skirrowii]AXX84405.1 type III pyridoxal 5-phosphate (PLP)-dependent enzyme, YggS family [Aliarcobacter skirrowii CCUG 10374]KAB0621420.1 YggS family pyridoxal phosphate-dependent enzyme [Aliarcobacter skirrowii CCUG 10374]RXI26677.1 YggS family pyridoxal phosphate-dependent enzyme [Aliarcobacter skirrowii CCUG 10374]SUV14564.1 Predicted enzyme with a TIM-barrel fold [Aliarcobacter skirrowii]